MLVVEEVLLLIIMQPLILVLEVVEMVLLKSLILQHLQDKLIQVVVVEVIKAEQVAQVSL